MGLDSVVEVDKLAEIRWVMVVVCCHILGKRRVVMLVSKGVVVEKQNRNG